MVITSTLCSALHLDAVVLPEIVYFLVQRERSSPPLAVPCFHFKHVALRVFTKQWRREKVPYLKGLVVSPISISVTQQLHHLTCK